MKRSCDNGHYFPDEKSSKRFFHDRNGVSPVIAVILLVAITVVLVSLLYIMVNGMITTTEFTPRGVLSFTEDSAIDGKYEGGFQGSVKLVSIEISFYDHSLGQGAVMDPSVETTAQVPGGMNITLTDVNSNSKLDGIDSIIIESGDPGDTISIVYKSTGEIVGSDVLT